MSGYCDAPAEMTMPDGTTLMCPDIPLTDENTETCHCGGKVRYGRCTECRCRAWTEPNAAGYRFPHPSPCDCTKCGEAVAAQTTVWTDGDGS